MSLVEKIRSQYKKGIELKPSVSTVKYVQMPISTTEQGASSSHIPSEILYSGIIWENNKFREYKLILKLNPQGQALILAGYSADKLEKDVHYTLKEIVLTKEEDSRGAGRRNIAALLNRRYYPRRKRIQKKN